MARIIYSGLVTQIKGSIGGSTFQANRYGFTIKNKANVSRPRTLNQAQSKVYFAGATNTWRRLTDAQRDAWNAWAAANPQPSKNNPSAILSGQAVFTKVHIQKFLEAGGISDFSTLPSYDMVSFDNVVFTVERAGGVLNLSYVWDNARNDHKANIFISQAFANSQNFVGSRTRYITTISDTNGTTDIASDYTAKYGTLPEVGSRVFVENVQFNPSNGQVFARVKSSVEVV